MLFIIARQQVGNSGSFYQVMVRLDNREYWELLGVFPKINLSLQVAEVCMQLQDFFCTNIDRHMDEGIDLIKLRQDWKKDFAEQIYVD